MGENKNFFLEKDKNTKETIYIEYKNIDGYKIKPKTKKEDAIEVTKIVFASPTLAEKIIKKKIDKKIAYLLNILDSLDEDNSDSGDVIRNSLVEAERLKLMIISTYVKYLGNTYQSLTLKKIQIIINELRLKLYMLKDSNNYIQISNKKR